jgi:hypothetical protein
MMPEAARQMTQARLPSNPLLEFKILLVLVMWGSNQTYKSCGLGLRTFNLPYFHFMPRRNQEVIGQSAGMGTLVENDRCFPEFPKEIPTRIDQ